MGGMGAAALLLVAACSQQPSEAPRPAAAGSSAPSTSGPGDALKGPEKVDEVATSPNVKLVVNVPPSGLLNGPEAWGTDLAFQGNYAFVGNYEGFTIYDISQPTKPSVVSQVVCPGGQNDVSISGDLLFVSVDDRRSDETCEADRGDPTSPKAWEGVRIFDVSDKTRPKYITSIATSCGSHTHSLVPGKSADTLYVYVSSPGPEPGTTTCKPPHTDISIIEVPTKDPAKAKVIAQPDIFPQGAGDQQVAGCHDITAYPEKKLAAAACFGDGVLLDIADPAKPKVLQQIRDTENFAVWHSATFNNDATKVVFTDELGGGATATCTAETPNTKGANAIYDLKDGKLTKRTYFKMPRAQTGDENCVAHNGSLLPIPGKDIMVQAWYQGGVSIWDFTDSDNPKEIGYFERGPIGGGEGMLGGSWSAYYYNGYIYSSDITKGLDVLDISDPLTDPAKKARIDEFNVQTQVGY
ncbi:hypothetical protein Ssi02_09550 [Sinosporangium siamense]|uniref:LVIVD repeat-containing protein n=2 Tax=Sinosporangium siamense TaxID=1367973 RepID=A0A919VA39_9ACTN|nr:hypothetical protein Ssi02_09550 [Sinosporangium siamense]